KLEQMLMENAERLSKVNPKRLARAEDLFTDALDGLERMRELVKSLRDFSRLEEAEMKPANINACLDSALKIAHHQIKNAVLVVRDYADLPETLCYPAKLNQVFLNLINNAAHACEKRYQGTQKGVLKIQTEQKGERIIVKISDNGTGIAKEHLNKIFDPFFTTKKVGEGTGLGLSISYKIIEEHNGKISVESKEGEGTTFTIEIPLRTQTAKSSMFIDAETAHA
ncbi:MAG: sensor histidine kinase, partial [Chloroherpetonaceae bacterium]